MGMGLQQGIFAVKLCELEEEYGRLQSRLRICQEKDSSQIHGAWEQLRDECREQDLLLEQRVQGCRMRSVAELARIQLSCRRQIEHLLQTDLEEEMRGSNSTIAQDHAEASSLFAEYAIDFATQTVRYALSVAMQALELQKRADEENERDQTRSVNIHE